MNINDYNKVTDRITISERCREEVLNMSKGTKKINRKMNKKVFIGLVAAAVLACGGTAVATADHFGVFDRLGANKEKTVVLDDGREVPDLNMKYINDNYENIAEHTQPADEIVKEETVTDSGLNVDVESVYCDGMNLIIGITGSLNNGNPDAVDYIDLGTEIEINGKVYRSDSVDWICFDSFLMLDEGTENDFTGNIKLSFKNNERLTEAATANIRLYNTIDIEEWYIGNSLDALENPLELSVEVTPDTSLIEETGLSFSYEGFEAKIYEISPDAITVGTAYPADCDTIETYCVDENGEKIPFIGMYTQPDYGDGLHTFICSNTNPSQITVIWIGKNTGEIVYEHTFDIAG